jgi:hypothetical protein
MDAHCEWKSISRFQLGVVINRVFGQTLTPDERRSITLTTKYEFGILASSAGDPKTISAPARGWI